MKVIKITSLMIFLFISNMFATSVHTPDTSKLNELLYAGFHDDGEKLIANFKDGVKLEVLSRFFDQAVKKGANLPLDVSRREQLQSVLFPQLSKLIENLKSKRWFRGYFTLNPKGNNVPTSEEIKAMIELAADEKKVIDAVIGDVKNLLLDGNRLRSEFEPYIFKDKSTDETLDKLYEHVNLETANKIHGGLIYNIVLIQIQDLYSQGLGDAAVSYSEYFEPTLDIPMKLTTGRLEQVQKYLGENTTQQ